MTSTVSVAQNQMQTEEAEFPAEVPDCGEAAEDEILHSRSMRFHAPLLACSTSLRLISLPKLTRPEADAE